MKTVVKRTTLSTRPPTRLRTDLGSDPVRVASAFFEWRPQSAVLRLGLILVPIALIRVGWSYYRDHSNHTARREVPPAISPPPEVAPPIQGAPPPSDTPHLPPDGTDPTA